jgi:signal transduction histidine kinase
MPIADGLDSGEGARLLGRLPQESKLSPDDQSIADFAKYLEHRLLPGGPSHRMREALSLFRTFSAEGQSLRLPTLYLQWEHDQATPETRRALRLEICDVLSQNFSSVLALPHFGVIFLRERPQEFYLCRLVLVSMLREVNKFTDQVNGESLPRIISWLERAPNSEHPVPLKLHKSVPKYNSEWTGLLMRMSEKLFKELVGNLGEALTLSCYDRAYSTALETYALLDTFSITAYLLPKDLLDAQEMGTVKRSAMRENYLRCIDSSNHHTNRLAGQNDELMEIRRELEQSKAELEARVESRTSELSAAKEQAELAARAKGEFLATMSHELRTPLNAILGFSEMIAQAALGPVDQRYRDYGTHIMSSGQHLLSLVNDVLDLSKLESGKFEIHQEWVDIGALLKNCKEMVIGLANEADIVLSVKKDENLGPVWADPLRLKQIVVNLLSNAIKFTGAGGWIKVSVRVASNHDMIIEVADSGIGMNAQGIKKALEPFGQVDSPINRSQGGTGLGLPVVKHLAELHGGSLNLTSAPGSGTCATIRLPTAGSAKEAVA